MTRPHAADDFATIHRRMKELRRETASPPPWVPTIFMREPTPLEVARRFWHIRAGR